MNLRERRKGKKAKKEVNAQAGGIMQHEMMYPRVAMS